MQCIGMSDDAMRLDAMRLVLPLISSFVVGLHAQTIPVLVDHVLVDTALVDMCLLTCARGPVLVDLCLSVLVDMCL